MPGSVLKGRVVFKIGSSTITGSGGFVDRGFLEELGQVMADLIHKGVQPVLVSSGAVALGREKLGLERRPRHIHERQALAAVGQAALMEAYAGVFAPRGLTTAQVLLTRDVVTDREKYLNARATLEELLRRKVVPVVNENDTVVIDELKFGDNDTLSAMTAQMVSATALVLMSDVPGFFDGNPKLMKNAMPIKEADPFDSRLEAMAGKEGSDLGSGGMATKLGAARLAAQTGIETYIIQGKPLDHLKALTRGENPGTRFLAKRAKGGAKKQWLRLLPEKGRLTLNEGAAEAVRRGKKSLLPSGVTSAAGDFQRGDLVGIHDQSGLKFALGLSNYDAKDTNKLLGLKSAEIEKALGYRFEDELVHRDLLVLLDG